MRTRFSSSSGNMTSRTLKYTGMGSKFDVIPVNAIGTKKLTD